MIMTALIKCNGDLTQSKIAKETSLSRVKISRAIKNLEQKKLLTKMPDGMTNKIILDAELRTVFCDK